MTTRTAALLLLLLGCGRSSQDLHQDNQALTNEQLKVILNSYKSNGHSPFTHAEASHHSHSHDDWHSPLTRDKGARSVSPRDGSHSQCQPRYAHSGGNCIQPSQLRNKDWIFNNREKSVKVKVHVFPCVVPFDINVTVRIDVTVAPDYDIYLAENSYHFGINDLQTWRELLVEVFAYLAYWYIKITCGNVQVNQPILDVRLSSIKQIKIEIIGDVLWYTGYKREICQPINNALSTTTAIATTSTTTTATRSTATTSTETSTSASTMTELTTTTVALNSITISTNLTGSDEPRSPVMQDSQDSAGQAQLYWLLLLLLVPVVLAIAWVCVARRRKTSPQNKPLASRPSFQRHDSINSMYGEIGDCSREPEPDHAALDRKQSHHSINSMYGEVGFTAGNKNKRGFVGNFPQDQLESQDYVEMKGMDIEENIYEN